MSNPNQCRAENLERLRFQFQSKIGLPDADLLRYLKSAPTGRSAKEMLIDAGHFIYDPFDFQARWQAGLISEEEYRRKARWALLQLEAWLNYCHQELCLDPFRSPLPMSRPLAVESISLPESPQPSVSDPLDEELHQSEEDLLPSGLNSDNPFVVAAKSGRRSQILGSVIDDFHRSNGEE